MFFMKKVNVLIILSILFLGIGCTNTQKQAENKESATAEKAHDEHENHAAESAAIQLDNGKKWAANPETTEGVKKMTALVETYLANNSTDTKILHDNLETEFTTIFQKCTMTGESHNQLHNFLLPLKDRLGKIETHADAETLNELKSYLASYNTYFQ